MTNTNPIKWHISFKVHTHTIMQTHTHIQTYAHVLSLTPKTQWRTQSDAQFSLKTVVSGCYSLKAQLVQQHLEKGMKACDQNYDVVIGCIIQLYQCRNRHAFILQMPMQKSSVFGLITLQHMNNGNDQGKSKEHQWQYLRKLY